MEKGSAEVEELILEINTARISFAEEEEEEARLVVSLKDITERKRVEVALRESEEKYRLLVEEMPLGVYRSTGDPSGRFLFANSALAWMLGYSTVGELQQVAVADVYRDPEERARFIALLDRDGAVENHELELRRKDGSPLRARVSARVSHVSDGGNLRVDGIVEDITAQKQLAEQLRQAQKMEAMGQLVGGLAHDFNNILCIILNNAELGLDGLDPQAPPCENLIEIRTAARRSAEMVRQLLTFSRKQVVNPRVVDLNHLIADHLRMLGRLIGADITVTFAPASGLWNVRIDPSQIGQILNNLAVNARDAIAGIGTIAIGTTNVRMEAAAVANFAGMTPGEYVRLTFSDTGSGMDRETLQHLFEPFFTTKAGRGTGLGLATVYGIAKQNRGFVYAASEPGRGTTLTLYLPRIADEIGEAASAVAEEPRPGVETVLVVDDEEKLVKAARAILERHGYTVLAAETAAAAVRLAAGHPGTIHLLLTDVIMPELNGRELQLKIMALRPGIRTLFMSGHTAGVLTERGVLAAGVALIEKPFPPKALLRKVRAVLDGGGAGGDTKSNRNEVTE